MWILPFLDFCFYSPLRFWSGLYIFGVFTVPDLFNLGSFLSIWFSAWTIAPALPWDGPLFGGLRWKGAPAIPALHSHHALWLTTDMFGQWNFLPRSAAVLNSACWVYRSVLVISKSSSLSDTHCLPALPLAQMPIHRRSGGCCVTFHYGLIIWSLWEHPFAQFYEDWTWPVTFLS